MHFKIRLLAVPAIGLTRVAGGQEFKYSFSKRTAACHELTDPSRVILNHPLNSYSTVYSFFIPGQLNNNL
jgi:hypothetical protein